MKLKTYIAKPVSIQAILVTKENIEEVAEIINGSVHPTNSRITFQNKLHNSLLDIFPDEYLCQGKNEGDFYPCKAQVFEEKYVEKGDEEKYLKITLEKNGPRMESNMSMRENLEITVVNLMTHIEICRDAMDRDTFKRFCTAILEDLLREMNKNNSVITDKF